MVSRVLWDYLMWVISIFYPFIYLFIIKEFKEYSLYADTLLKPRTDLNKISHKDLGRNISHIF